MEVGKVLHPVAKEKMKVDTRLWWSCWVLSFCYTKIPQTHQVWWHLSWCAPTLPAAISSELWPAYLACKLHISNETTPRKPTWQWKITIVDRRYIFKCLAFHCHASSPGCIVPNISKPTLVSLKHQKLRRSFASKFPARPFQKTPSFWWWVILLWVSHTISCFAVRWFHSTSNQSSGPPHFKCQP